MGRRRRNSAPKGPQPKKASYQLIERVSEVGAVLYGMLDDLVERFHDEVSDARIALAWNTSWKPDADGNVTLGKCKKASDLDRELAPWDFVILLRREWFENISVTNDQRRALIDHELCHCTLKLDKNSEPVEDSRGRKVYRMRKHDLEEFSQIVERYGLYKRDLEHFAAALRRSQQRSLLEDENESAAEKLAKGNPAFRLAPAKADNGDGKPQLPSTNDAAAALAKVAAIVEVRYHSKGERCEKATCGRRHLTLEQLEAAGIKPEDGARVGTPAATDTDDAAEDPRAKCAGCGAVLKASEVVKRMGLCETCQVQPHEEIH